MPDQPISALREQVDESVRSVEGLTVERGKVAEFAGAIKDPAPVFLDRDAAADRGLPGIAAPPTFTRVAYFPRYRPDGVTSAFGFDLGFDRSKTVHGEQEYEYERPLIVGDTLSGTTTLRDVYERTGSGGRTLTFAVLETVYRDGENEPVVTERRTRIEIERDDDGATDPDDDPVDGSAVSVEPTDPAAVTWDGDGPVMTVPGPSAIDFIRYAGASGDFNPIHVSESGARATGAPSVFGHGMLTMALAGRFVREWVGLAAIKRFRARFESRVWPGDALRITGERTDAGLSFEVRNEREAVVMTGDAAVRRR